MVQAQHSDMKQISITLPDDMADALLTNESFLSRCKELGIEVKESHEASGLSGQNYRDFIVLGSVAGNKLLREFGW
jgi:hypothetical protein